MSEKPLPPGVEVDEISRPFYEAAKSGVLRVQRCQACGTAQLGNSLCFACQNPRLEWIEATGRAFLHSFVVLHIPYHPAFQPPYTAAIVELEEGPRIPAYVEASNLLRIGQEVRLEFSPVEGENFVPVVRSVLQ